MQEINYIGENLLPGKLGHFLLLLAFVSAGLSCYSYFQFTRKEEGAKAGEWKRMGRIAFVVQGVSIFGVIGVIFYMMLNRMYEYEYVWSHVADHLPMHYLFPAFWEGQQGSFLLWLFWHAVLGFILLKTAKEWEASTLAVLSSVQVILLSMILGIYFHPEVRIGVSAFNLLRESEGMVDLPVFANANYLSLIEGKGLNPLLQNYWMIIHPPTLFLGFASVTIPFCYAIAGFWRRSYKTWLKPVLPWALFSGAILGTGIVMGGAWAYEALSFGGYWAWDPVENASLVPWLILIGGIHMNLVARSTGHSIKGTYLFYGLTFLFVLYSTFLTRSGILGDSSVHAFTEMGLEWQLVLFMGFYLLLMIFQFISHRRKIDVPSKEEEIPSREFWMFIGSLVLLFSSGLITFTTSLPVLNKLLDVFGSLTGQDMSSWHKASPVDAMSHYNRYQMWIAVFIGLLSGFCQYLIYRGSGWENKKKTFYRNVAVSTGTALALTLALNLWIKTGHFSYSLLLFSASFAITANLQYFYQFLKLRLRNAASILSHVGFGLMIVGIMASGINKKFISNNEFAMRGIFEEDDERLHRNVYLVKGEPLFMGGFLATYVSDTMINHDRRYDIRFDRLAQDNKTVTESFTLHPYLTYNAQKTEMVNPNPDTRRYLHKDIFSHITAAPSRHIGMEAAKEEDERLSYDTVHLTIRDTLLYGGMKIVLQSLQSQPTHPEYEFKEGDIAYGASIWVQDSVEEGVASPMLAIRDQRFIYSYYDDVSSMGVRIRLMEEGIAALYPDEQKLIYETFRKKLGEQFDFEGYQIKVAGFDKNPKLPGYQPQAGDIAVAVLLEIESRDGFRGTAKPIFMIRENQTFMIKDFLADAGLSFRFASIDPTTELLDLMVASTGDEPVSIPVEVAMDAPRDDFIVLEAIEFPGINLFWIGTSMMMFGMLLGMAVKIGKSKV